MCSRLVKKKKKKETTCKNVFILLEHRALFSFPEGLETKAIFPSLPRSQRRTRFPEICSQASCRFRIDHPYGTWGKVHLRMDKLSYHLTSIRQTVGYGLFHDHLPTLWDVENENGESCILGSSCGRPRCIIWTKRFLNKRDCKSKSHQKSELMSDAENFTQILFKLRKRYWADSVVFWFLCRWPWRIENPLLFKFMLNKSWCKSTFAFFIDEMKSSPVFLYYHFDRKTAYYCKRSVKLSDTLDAFP